MREQVVLAYSGGLDTSIIIPWLKENYNCDVIAMIADVGQGEDIDAVVEKAHKTGAAKVIVKDLREEFLRDYVFPALRAGAEYEHKYLLGTSLARPVQRWRTAAPAKAMTRSGSNTLFRRWRQT
jgi:argininosuccinate synthase